VRTGVVGLAVLVLALPGVAGAGVAGGAGRHLRPAALRLQVTDPNFAGGYQVGDALTVYAAVRDPNVSRPSGWVSFSTDDRYSPGCSRVPLRNGIAACYPTFYLPGRHLVRALFQGHDGARASATVRFSVVANTSD